jgi:aerobic carbon-monoxide dehydrogenase small subunit
MMRVNLTVNGRPVTADVEPRLQLADFLREHLLLTGTHIGCEHGVCGACTVLLGGAPARSCIAYTAACEGTEVRTIEGLDSDLTVQRLRVAFSAEHALQCGYCTPGMLVTARDIVLRLPDADASRIRLELAGNLCRCTGYAGIVRAIGRVLREARAEAGSLVAAASGVIPVQAPDGILDPAFREADDEHRGPDREAGDKMRASDANSARVSTDPTIALRLRIQRPRSEIWRALHDPALLAACVPGARLVSAAEGNIKGEVQVALGPITALFTGSGSLTFDNAAQRVTLSGEGNDRRSATRLSATAVVTLAEAGSAASDVAVAISYAVRGTLAQIARGPVVRAFATDVAQSVARNLERRLAGEPSVVEPAYLSLSRLFVRIVWQRLRRWLALR